MTSVSTHVAHVSGRAASRERRRGAGNRGVLAAVVVLTAAGAFGAARVRAVDTGPLETAGASVQAGVGARSLHVGQSFCYGLVVIRNASPRPATLQSVAVAGGEGVTVGPAHVMGSERDVTTGTADACPRQGRPLSGHVVPPRSGTGDDQGVQVLLPIRIDRPGKTRIDGVKIAYRVDGRTYVVEDPTDVVACTYACDARPGGR